MFKEISTWQVESIILDMKVTSYDIDVLLINRSKLALLFLSIVVSMLSIMYINGFIIISK